MPTEVGKSRDAKGELLSCRPQLTATIRLGSVAGQQTAPAFWQALAAWGAENQRCLARIYETGAGSLEGARCSARRLNIELSDHRARFEQQNVADLFTIVGHSAVSKWRRSAGLRFGGVTGQG